MNATPSKYDLSSDTPPMIGEIKLCGGDYQSKMQGLIEDDVEKLRRGEHGSEKLMILIIDTRVPNSTLGTWLSSYSPQHDDYAKVDGTNVMIRIWKIKEDQPAA